jgi:hypothetical protein
MIVDHFDKAEYYYKMLKTNIKFINFIYFREDELKKEYIEKTKNNFKKLRTYVNGGLKNVYKLYDLNYLNNLILQYDNIFAYNDNTFTVQYLFSKNIQIDLIEDGLSNYVPLINKNNIFKNLLFAALKIPQPMGRSNFVKNIFVQHPEKLPKDIINKGKKLPLTNMISELSPKKKKIILDVFLNENNENLFKNINNKSMNCLIITQPLSETNYIKEDEKIYVYKYLIQKYSRESYKIYIKPHPLEKTNYNILFDDVVVIDNSIPLEILNLIDTNFFALGVTFFSSALYNLNIDKKIFYGENFIKKILRGNNEIK